MNDLEQTDGRALHRAGGRYRCGGACNGDAGEDAARLGADVPEEERYGGTAVIGSIGDIPDVNPLTSTDHTANQVQQFVLFTPLVRYDENFEPVPWYAPAPGS
jgi:hypothetical protein